MKAGRDNIKELITGTKPYKKYRKILKTIEEGVDLKALEKEIKDIHFSRTVRHLQPTKINQKNMIEASLKEVQGRARLVEIKANLLEYKMNLEDMVAAVKKYTYSEFQIDGIKTKTDRKDYMSRYFRSADRFLAQLEYITRLVDSFVEDIDSSSFKFNNLVKLLEMIYQRERTI